MLGEAFYKKFSHDFDLKCTDIDVNEDWLSFLDFRNYESYKKDLNNYKPNWLFHLGAYTDLEYCELHEEETYVTNTESVKHAVKIANDLDIPILYISTAGIFDGRKGVYDESDKPNPIGHYAKSKYIAEEYVLNNANDYLICRAGWMMGGGPKKDKKFIQKIMKQLKEGEKELHIVNDKLGTPTYTHDFAENVKLLIQKGKGGLFNMVCGGLTGRFEVETELIQLLGLKDEIKIIKVDSDYFSKEYFADRPACERLINKRLDDLGLNIMRDWKVTLKEYLENYYSYYPLF
ncbi:MAG: NAD(P)-dependent oxidoreductase [Candidatus Marinimicrobia bacterium]|nr:NAD(P)-dependent oxidoreductase [Candidatus Neomarinimicrobiota bacterium]